jgi:hypothetical protein
MREWIRIPLRETLTAATYLQECRGRRCVPTNHRALPGITARGMIPESRAGWVGDWMARPKRDVAIPGAYTFVSLENEHQKPTSCSDFIGDSCVNCLACETQVLPSGISTRQLHYSYGGIFYREAVSLTHLLIKCMPIATMAAGAECVSNALKNPVLPLACGVQGARSTANNWPDVRNVLPLRKREMLAWGSTPWRRSCSTSCRNDQYPTS